MDKILAGALTFAEAIIGMAVVLVVAVWACERFGPLWILGGLLVLATVLA